MKYDVVGFEEPIRVRLHKDSLKLLKRILKKDPETYDSISHFVRSATLKRLREEKLRLRL